MDQEYKLIANGNANLVLQKIGDQEHIYRVCYRYADLKLNNQFTEQNFKYIESVVKPLFVQAAMDSLWAGIQLVSLPLSTQLKALLIYYDVMSNESHVICFKMKNYRNYNVQTNIFKEKFLKIDILDNARIMLEFKPKLLYEKDEMTFCRDCTNQLRKTGKLPIVCNSLMLRRIDMICKLFPSNKCDKQVVNRLYDYLKSEDNVFMILRMLQKSASNEDIQLEMLLRDVTVFIVIYPNKTDIEAVIIDFDLKPIENKAKWIKLKQKIEAFPNKVVHPPFDIQ